MRWLTGLRAVAAFCYGFVVGEDWRVAAGVLVALGATAGLVDAGVNAWWLPPAAVVVLLVGSLRRAAAPRRARFPESPPAHRPDHEGVCAASRPQAGRGPEDVP